jgi:hypothetical protein
MASGTASAKKLDTPDTIRAGLAGVQSQNSVGELAHPVASKIVHRIGDATRK